MTEAKQKTQALPPVVEQEPAKPGAGEAQLPAKRLPQYSNELVPRNFDDAYRFAQMIHRGGMGVKDDTVDAIMVKVMMGHEVGLSPMQAVQNIAVINNRPSVWGDAMLAIVQASPHYEGHREWYEGEGDLLTAHCTVKRRNQEAHTATFSVADAKTAGLWKKAGPWTTSPKRMLMMRARAFACRDKFADALRGINVAEEVQDIPVVGYSDVSGDAPDARTPPLATSAVVQELQSRAGTQDAAAKPHAAAPGAESPAADEPGQTDTPTDEPGPDGDEPVDDGAPELSLADERLQRIANATTSDELEGVGQDAAHEAHQLGQSDRARIQQALKARRIELAQK